MSFEGIDYIFDRYAYLGIEVYADTKVIKRAIALKKAECHPDLLTPLRGQKFLAESLAKMESEFDEKRKLIAQCEEVLLSDTSRKVFDDNLKKFKAEDLQLVSDDGRWLKECYRSLILI